MRGAGKTALHMLVGFLLMGGWALIANRHHPMPAPLIAGLLQGVLSACITFVMKIMLEKLVFSLNGYVALIIPPMIAALISVSVLSILHTLAKTPEVLATIIFPVTVATVYSVTYTYSIWTRTRGE
ncbi:hypothetical protein [Parasulfitobacter algicola]|uniref:LrgA family protein n=1 Tax=Parasulfitobacter algicola TaxID=2614809 RepID=A0ABX2IPP2_9RHOB|nr:hypothetical protein [Sulfitobacter algicola]NSX53966.1 hypothetical protein [Sulfitobacter algicola]